MNIREEVYRLFCVPRCTSCKNYLKRGESVLCQDCLELFQGEKVRDCSFCFQKITHCACTPKVFKKAKIHHLFKVSRYYTNLEESPTKKLIFSLKKENLRTVIGFMAQELATVLSNYYGEASPELVIIPIPRRKANIIKFGYDHAFELARRISILLNCQFSRALVSLTRRDQKGLTREERRDNVKFKLKKNVELKGKRILILDDIVTTGASMVVAAKLLSTLSPKEMDGACFAVSYRDIDLNSSIPF